MLEAVEGVPLFAEPRPAEAILARCDGAGRHVPHAPSLDGIARTAREMEPVGFPRAEAAGILEDYGRAIGAPERSLAGARRLAGPGSLVVATGQQPCAAGGPLFVLYKALTAIALARAAEARLGVPVVPVFWNASEDHDLDEVAAAAAPGQGGALVRFRVDLTPWRGKPVAAVESDPRWTGPVGGWVESLPGAAERADLVRLLLPRPTEGWARWFSRLLADLLGPEGLVVIEPQPLRHLARPILARAVRDWRAIADELVPSSSSSSSSSDDEFPGGRAFPPLDGPAVFREHEGFRRRVVEKDGMFVLRGTDVSFDVETLARLAEAEPERFSSHAVLRPVVQNAVLPVVAQVLGPGEIAYQSQILRFHVSGLGAGRRMPVMWPRLSATVLDARAVATVERFGIGGRDIFLPAGELIARFAPKGLLAGRLRDLARAAEEALDGTREGIMGLDATLERPFGKTRRAIRHAYSALASKVEAAEGRAIGLAPERLRRLADGVRPGGRPQERVLAFASVLVRAGANFVAELLDGLDVSDRRHRLIRLDERGAEA